MVGSLPEEDFFCHLWAINLGIVHQMTTNATKTFIPKSLMDGNEKMEEPGIDHSSSGMVFKIFKVSGCT